MSLKIRVSRRVRGAHRRRAPGTAVAAALVSATLLTPLACGDSGDATVTSGSESESESASSPSASDSVASGPSLTIQTVTSASPKTTGTDPDATAGSTEGDTSTETTAVEPELTCDEHLQLVKDALGALGSCETDLDCVAHAIDFCGPNAVPGCHLFVNAQDDLSEFDAAVDGYVNAGCPQDDCTCEMEPVVYCDTNEGSCASI